MKSITVEQRPDGVAIVTFDVPGQAVNTLTPGLIEEVEQEVLPLLENGAILAVVLASGKPDGFIAGADLNVIGEMQSAEEVSALSKNGNALLSRIAASSKPVVAAIHGPALGGGLEVALACRYLLASDSDKTVLGLPEVQLGLLPAGGGTQRLPRKIGLARALPMLLTGRRLRARRALKIGLVDGLTTPGGIAETAARIALQLAEGQGVKKRKIKKTFAEKMADSGPLRNVAINKARTQVERKTRGLYPAPAAILDCVETGLSKGIDAGLTKEAEHFGKLAVGPESRALVWLFHATNELKKKNEAVESRQVKRLAVLGAGFMGAGIASVSLARCPVVLRDIDDDALAAGGRTVFEGLKKQRRSGSITEAELDTRLSRLLLTKNVDYLRGVDLVVEAVFEDLALKHKVIAEAEERVRDDTVLASNTSALPIADIAAKAQHPERILGMHYFSPVPRMPLLEIIEGPKTAPWATETARRFGIAQGKTVIVVQDGPGFYTSRILAPYLNEAMALLEAGARIEDVDRVAKQFGFPVGPIALLDEVGIDVGAHVSQDLGKRFAERGGEPSDALVRLFEAGHHGRKNGKGFYIYPPPDKKTRKKVNESIYSFFGGAERKSLDVDMLRDRMVLLMVNEAVHCAQEEIIACPRDGDIGAVLGLGFAPFRGGPFRYVDSRGAAEVHGRLEELASEYGKRFAPAQLLGEMARSGRTFC